MPNLLFSILRAALCLLCLAGANLAVAQDAKVEEPGPNLIATPGASDFESGGLDLRGAAGAGDAGISGLPIPTPAAKAPVPTPGAETATPPSPAEPRPQITLEADSLTPPEMDEPVSGAPGTPTAPEEPASRSRVSAEIPVPNIDSTRGDAAAMTSVKEGLEQEGVAQEQTNSVLVYLGLFVGGSVILLLILVLTLSQQNRRKSRRKRRRKSDAPLKQRVAISPQSGSREAGNSHAPVMSSGAAVVPSRFGGGPRRVTGRHGSPATSPMAVGHVNKPSSAGTAPDAREEYSTLFEHMLRMNRLREGEPDAPLDRMTLAELHLHFNALLRIIPTDAREPLVESIEMILEELEGQGD